MGICCKTIFVIGITQIVYVYINLLSLFIIFYIECKHICRTTNI